MNNLRTSPLSSAKTFPLIFFIVHLLHRLYGADAPGNMYRNVRKLWICGMPADRQTDRQTDTPIAIIRPHPGGKVSMLYRTEDGLIHV